MANGNKIPWDDYDDTNKMVGSNRKPERKPTEPMSSVSRKYNKIEKDFIAKSPLYKGPEREGY